MKKGAFYTIFFMFAISIFFTAILASANLYYNPLIQKNEQISNMRSILYVLGMQNLTDQNQIADVFNESIKSKKLPQHYIYIKYDDNGDIKGYAFPFSGAGLWGQINGYIGISPDFKTILGVDFTSHSETPGLGGRIDEQWFKEQFRGIKISSDAGIVLNSSSLQDEDNGVDAITGATNTSRAVVNILNDFINEIIKENVKLLNENINSLEGVK